MTVTYSLRPTTAPGGATYTDSLPLTVSSPRHPEPQFPFRVAPLHLIAKRPTSMLCHHDHGSGLHYHSTRSGTSPAQPASTCSFNPRRRGRDTSTLSTRRRRASEGSSRSSPRLGREPWSLFRPGSLPAAHGGPISFVAVLLVLSRSEGLSASLSLRWTTVAGSYKPRAPPSYCRFCDAR